MPKEQITSPVTWRGIRPEDQGPCRCLYDGETCNCDDVCPTDTYPTIAVRWNGNGGNVVAPIPVEDIDTCNVQLTLSTYREIPWPEYKARLSEEGMDHFVPRDVEREYFSKVLTRHDINRLIKVLKRARDAAYGKDE